MNRLTPIVSDDENRSRIASFAPVSVYVRADDPEQYVSDQSGEYWPYRALTISQVRDDRKAAERTVDRTLAFRLVDDRDPGRNFTRELYELADEIGADQVLPIIHTGISRDAIAGPVRWYNGFDFQRQVDLVTPIPAPYGLTSGCVKTALYETHGVTAGIQTKSYPTDFGIRDLRTEADSIEGLDEVISTVRSTISGDARVHLENPTVDGSLIRYIRAYPGRINSLTVSPETVKDTTMEGAGETDSLLSGAGLRDLGGGMDPLVRIAAELSFLSSSLVDDHSLAEAIEASVFVDDQDDNLPSVQTRASQGTLTNLLS